MAKVARIVNRSTKGTIRPVHITLMSLLGHIPAAWALWTCRPILAASLITIFGILDSLDGALAREQGSVSKLGMLFDAITDRMKEALIYVALAAFAMQHETDLSAWAVVALASTSLLVSYVKAKGEMALSSRIDDVQKLNRMFDGGFARYEVRMTLIVLGLLTGYLAPLVHLAIAFNLLTAAIRFMLIAQMITEQEARTHLSTVQKKPKKAKAKKRG